MKKKKLTKKEIMATIKNPFNGDVWDRLSEKYKIKIKIEYPNSRKNNAI